MGRLSRAGLRRAEVPGAFDMGAAAYDSLVGANPGYHDHLRISARRMRIADGGQQSTHSSESECARCRGGGHRTLKVDSTVEPGQGRRPRVPLFA